MWTFDPLLLLETFYFWLYHFYMKKTGINILCQYSLSDPILPLHNKFYWLCHVYLPNISKIIDFFPNFFSCCFVVMMREISVNSTRSFVSKTWHSFPICYYRFNIIEIFAGFSGRYKVLWELPQYLFRFSSKASEFAYIYLRLTCWVEINGIYDNTKYIFTLSIV